MVKGLTILFFFACQSCKKPTDCALPPDPVLIRFVDSYYRDLLNPANATGYNPSDMNLTYIDNGIQVSVPITIETVNSSGVYVLNTEIALHADQGRTFYLQLSPSDTDTIYARVDRFEGNCTWFKTKDFLYNNMTQARSYSSPSQHYYYTIRK